VLPDVKLAWRDVWHGSVVAAILMALGGLLIGLYFSLGGIHSAFEAAGAFAVIMIAIFFCPDLSAGCSDNQDLCLQIWFKTDLLRNEFFLEPAERGNIKAT
jgi:hypothetical protein